MSFIYEVAFEGFEEERSRFLHFVVFEEDLGHCFDGCFGVALGVTGCDHFGQADGGLGVAGDDWAEDFYEVGSVVHLLAVRDNLIKLVRFNKCLDNFIRVTWLLESFERELGIILTDSVTKLITHC